VVTVSAVGLTLRAIEGAGTVGELTRVADEEPIPRLLKKLPP
jgi:hypothetical protein